MATFSPKHQGACSDMIPPHLETGRVMTISVFLKEDLEILTNMLIERWYFVTASKK